MEENRVTSMEFSENKIQEVTLTQLNDNSCINNTNAVTTNSVERVEQSQSANFTQINEDADKSVVESFVTTSTEPHQEDQAAKESNITNGNEASSEVSFNKESATEGDDKNNNNTAMETNDLGKDDTTKFHEFCNFKSTIENVQLNKIESDAKNDSDANNQIKCDSFQSELEKNEEAANMEMKKVDSHVKKENTYVVLKEEDESSKVSNENTSTTEKAATVEISADENMKDEGEKEMAANANTTVPAAGIDSCEAVKTELVIALESTPAEAEIATTPAAVDAVQAVVAAIEQSRSEQQPSSVAGSQSTITTTTPTKRKPSNKPASSSSTSTSPHQDNSKRRKKDPSAPKAPLNGYLLYFNEERAGMRAKNPTIGFGELTKVIATKWKELPTEQKQKYITEADQDKERYEKEMANYKKSDAYKQFLKETSANKSSIRMELDLKHHANPNQSSIDLLKHASMSHTDHPNMTWLQTESNVAGFDIPIFTEEFVEHSKSRAHELKQLRKEVAELERQVHTAHAQIDNMRKQSASVDAECAHVHARNDHLQNNSDVLKQTLLNCFQKAAASLPQDRVFLVERDNLDEYIFKMSAFLKKQPLSQQDDNIINFFLLVKSIISQINFNPFFGSI